MGRKQTKMDYGIYTMAKAEASKTDYYGMAKQGTTYRGKISGSIYA